MEGQHTIPHQFQAHLWQGAFRVTAAVAVIGAGSSGLTVLKALLEAGLPAVCFERGSRVGGNWVFNNDNQQSRIYRSLRINTSRDRMQFSDFPMPAEYPDYASHEQVARYFEAYAEAFRLAPQIRFRCGVERVEPSVDGYRVRTSDGVEQDFGAVIVANGHHWDPAYPNPMPPGRFDGVVMHSHHYVSPQEPHALADKRVVVVGIGNSAVDIASELAKSGARVTLSVRRGAWVLPKFAFGRPVDQPGIIPPWLPDKVKTALMETWYRVVVGDPGGHGLLAPDHRLLHAHPTLSDDLRPLLRDGKISPRPAISGFEGRSVSFVDGSTSRADAVIFCTGYHVTFPFFDPSFVSAEDNELPLFLRCFHLERRGLMFAGMAQPLGPIMPLVEAQGRLFARYLSGEYELPDTSEMRARTVREREHVRRRFVQSHRHTMQVDFDQYLADLARETRAGFGRSGRRRVP
jgi:hypothetical protein